jgi:hypothetical protein
MGARDQIPDTTPDRFEQAHNNIKNLHSKLEATIDCDSQQLRSDGSVGGPGTPSALVSGREAGDGHGEGDAGLRGPRRSALKRGDQARSTV